MKKIDKKEGKKLLDDIRKRKEYYEKNGQKFAHQDKKYECNYCQDRELIIEEVDGEEIARECPYCKRQKQIQRLFKSSGIPKKYKDCTFDNFIVTEDTKELYNTVMAWKEKFDLLPNNYEGLLLLGTFGAGKTHLLSAIAKHLIYELAVGTIYTSSLALAQELKDFSDVEMVAKKREQLKNIPVLIIDDFGKERTTPYIYDLYLQVLDHRYDNELPVLISSNMSEREIIQTYNTATFSRFFDTCDIVTVEADDYRLLRNQHKKPKK
jgi:DNA replication protein DnaC